MKTRLMELNDVVEVLEMELSSNAVRDPHLGLVCGEWAVDEEGLMSLIRVRADPALGTGGTRAYVVEDGEVQGAFVYELAQGEVELLWHSVHPDASCTQVVYEIAAHLKKVCSASERRRRAVLHLRDSDEAGLRQLMPAWRAQGFDISLSRDYFGSCDAWAMSWEA